MESNYLIESGVSRMTISSESVIESIGIKGVVEFVETPCASLLALRLEKPSTRNVRGEDVWISLEGNRPEVLQIEKGYRLAYQEIAHQAATWNIAVVIDITAEDGAFELVLSFENKEKEWIVRDVRCPVIGGMDTTGLDLLLPDYAGMRIPNPRNLRAKRTMYPGGWASMQWMALQGKSWGLYVASHDDTFQTTGLEADNNPETEYLEIAIAKYPICKPGQKWVSAPLIIKPYRGDWHVAADTYRKWAETWWYNIDRPDWVAKASGMQLVILKQQNGRIIWDYSELGKIADKAEEQGLDVVGLYGWTQGGHDHDYPIYEPDPDMGGEDGLRQGLGDIRKKGKWPVIYYNGHLVDMATEYYRNHGDEISIVDERGTHRAEYPMWEKYYDAAPVATVNACLGSDIWQKHLIKLTEQAYEFGACGVIYDRIGGTIPYLCFNEHHHHSSPAEAMSEGRRAFLQRIRKHMKAKDADFAIMTEVLSDCLCQFVDMVHGFGRGFAPGGENAFPEMFRYTFPELPITQRNTAPMQDRRTANYASALGFRHEVEFRYVEDKRYVMEGRRPTYRDYIEVTGRPIIQMIRETCFPQAASYLKSLLALEQDNGDLLRNACFLDNKGFENQNPELTCKAYSAGDNLGIVVWNPTDRSQKLRINVPGYVLERLCVPSGTGTSGNEEVNPGALCLLRYVRSGDIA
jgi:hypothetical protein